MAEPKENSWLNQIAGLLIEASLCAVAMTLPFLLLGSIFGGLLSVAIGLVWLSVSSLNALPEAKKPQQTKDPPGSPLGLTEMSAATAMFGVYTLAFVALTNLGYRDAEAYSFGYWLQLPGFEIPALLALASAIFLGLAVTRQRRAGKPLRALARPWLVSVSDMGAGITILAIVAGAAIHALPDTMDDTGLIEFGWGFFGRTPYLVYALPLAALLIVSKVKRFRTDFDAIWRTKTAIQVAGFPFAVAAILYVLHILFVMTAVAVPAFMTAVAAGTKTDDWVAKQIAEGVPLHEIVATMNEYGRESDLGSPEGVSALLPALGDAGSNCRIRLQAGLTDAAELEEIAPRKDDDATTARREFPKILHVKYCVKVSCPALLVRDEEPNQALYTSHPSNNQGWEHSLQADLLSRNDRSRPGGYCTGNGELAGEYQG